MSSEGNGDHKSSVEPRERDHSKCDTLMAHQLGIDVNHVSSNNIEVAVKYGVADSHDDGGGKDRGLLFVNFNLPFADINKEIGARCNLAPGSYLLQFRYGRHWIGIKRGTDWNSCLRITRGKRYIDLRCLRNPPPEFLCAEQ